MMESISGFCLGFIAAVFYFVAQFIGGMGFGAAVYQSWWVFVGFTVIGYIVFALLEGLLTCVDRRAL